MIKYRTDATVSPEQLASVFDASGIRRPTSDLNRLKQMIDRADLLISAWNDTQLVGVARSRTDFCFCCYLSDLAVHRDYQKMGVGRRLVALTREAIGEQTVLLLIAAPEADAYYPKLGFERLERGWWINRKR